MSDSAGGSSRPNIVFIQTDSQDGRILGCMGHPAMGRATPNIDRLARRGVMFPQAYTNNPICCPSRASMWSGQWTHHCEGWNNFKGLEPDTPTFRDRLDAGGYLTQTFGKLDFLSGAHTDRARVSAWLRSANIPRPTYWDHAPVIQEDRDEERSKDWKTVNKCVEWLRANAGGEQPLWMYLGLNLPHPGFTTNRRYAEMIDEAGIDVPPADREDHPCMRFQRMSKNWTHGWDEEMVRKLRLVYFAMIAETDAMVGRVLSAVEEAGIADNTYVIFTSDHGECTGEHRQYYKMNLYEPSARIPMVIAGPGLEAGKRVENLCSLVDIYPTLMDMAGRDCPDGLDGHSLLPACRGEKDDRPDWVLGEYHDSTMNTGSFMLRRGRWKYMAFVGYEPMLFDLEDDPWEVNNLAADRPEAKADMDRRLREIVDIDAVDAKVKAYDRESFRRWRAEHKAAGDYEEIMSAIFSGWSNVRSGLAEPTPWTEADEKLIDDWLAGSENREQIQNMPA